ncbi:MAG: hypothetical protein AAF236_00770 [Verrucomicrobiota bacterium]
MPAIVPCSQPEALPYLSESDALAALGEHLDGLSSRMNFFSIAGKLQRKGPNAFEAKVEEQGRSVVVRTRWAQIAILAGQEKPMIHLAR